VTNPRTPKTGAPTPVVDPAALSSLSRRRFLGLGGLTVLGAAAGGTLLTGCSSQSVSSRAADRHKDGVLQIAVAAAPSNINPLDSGSEVTRWIAEPVVETLYAYDESLASVPLLADGEPVISADKLTWTIKVRSGITWQNGDPLTADDVVATLAHVTDLSAGSEWITYFIGYVQSFQAVDKQTVAISLSKPYGLMRSHLTNLPIVHKDYVARKDAMMGTGPYKLDSFVPGQSFTMTRYAGYHGTKPTFNGITYTVLQDGATREVSLRQGKVDLITSVPFADLDNLKTAPDVAVQITEAPLDILTYVLIESGPFSDPNFRKAVALSMDRAGVVQKVFAGQATPGQGPIGPAEMGYTTLDVYSPTPDYAQARALLAKSSTPKSFTLTIGTENTIKNVAQVLAAGWAQVGIQVRIEQLTGGPWSNKWLSRGYDMLMNTFQSGFTSGPANYLTLAPADSTNVLSCGYKNPVADALLAVVWQTTDDNARAAALTKLDKILAEDAVIFPPAYPRLAVARLASLSPVDDNLLRASRLSPQTLHFTG
jgi:peptide/nickel transport system substrate-binding protein